MKHLLLILLLIASLSGKSQSTSQIDSLKNVLAKYSSQRTTFPSDTMRVRLLCAMAGQFNNPDSSLKYTKQAKNIATERNWVEGMYDSGFMVARDLYRKNLYYQALDVYFSLLTICEKNHFRKREAIVLRAIGDSYLYLYDYVLAKKNYRSSMAIFKSLNEYEEFADTQNNLAIVYNNTKEYATAIKLLNDCITYLPKIKGKWSAVSFYDNLSMSYNYCGKYDSSLKYSLKVLKKLDVLGNDNDSWKAQSMVLIGFRYLHLNQLDQALHYANLATKLLGNQAKERINLEELYYKIYKAKNDDKKALFYLENFKETENKKLKLEQEQISNSLKSLYNLDKEKSKVLLLNTSLEKENFQKKIGVFGIIIISVFLLFALWSFMNQKRKSKQIEQQKLAIEELNDSLEEKVNLRTQELSEANRELVTKNQEISEALYKGQSIERTRVASALHDNLGGSMAAVKWMLESIDTEKLSEDDKKVYQNALNITSEAYSDVRFMSHNFIPEVLAQLGLQDSVKKLCQEISQTKKLKMDFEDKTFSEFTHQIELEVYSICLELITNILKHSKANEAKILMQEDDYFLTIIVNDNGVGMTEKDVNGKGLKNIRKRLEAIKGTVEFERFADGKSTFSMTIPLTMKEEYMTPPQHENVT